jgi:23S rRNA (uracil1939-C5)-methyltransferase
VYHGNGYITDTLGKYSYRISANSFFQTNTNQAEQLYSTIQKFAEPKRNEIVYDLYSGTGSIAIYLSADVKAVVGIEVVESAVADAEQNAVFNGITNCEFIVGDLKDKLTKDYEWVQKYNKPHIIVVDPPRSGLHPKVDQEIIKIGPERVIYVSCNPATQARDTKMLVEGGYTFVKSQPVDMFPQTSHIENVALLRKTEL